MRKTTKKYVMLLLVALAIAGWLQSWRLQTQLRAARERVARLQTLHQVTRQALRAFTQSTPSPQPDTEPGHRLADEERQYYQRRMRRLEERIAFLETAVATVRAPGRMPITPEDMAIGEMADSSPMDVLLPVVTDPDLRDLLRIQMLATLEYEYEPLLTHFNYPYADEETLLALLLEKRWNAMQYRLIMMQDGLDPELRRHALAAIRDDHEDLRMALHEFLGDEDFDVYEIYEDTQPERMQVERFQQELLRHEIPLDEAQQRQLILILHEENQALETFIEAARGLEDADGGVPPELADLHHEAAENHHQRLLERAATILTEDQTATFMDFAVKQRALREATRRRAPAFDRR